MGVVPDGVASVTLHFPAQSGGANPAPPLSVTARPIKNAFIIRVPRSFIPQAFGGTTPDSIKWQAANGTVIRTIHPSFLVAWAMALKGTGNKQTPYRRACNRTPPRLRRRLETSANHRRRTRGRRVGGRLRWLYLDHEQHERGAQPGAKLDGQRAPRLDGDGWLAVGVPLRTPAQRPLVDPV